MNDSAKSLWQILVPTVRNDGRPIRTRFHRVWDAKVRDITGGLTINPPVRGQWIDPATDKLYAERMIPVQIACTESEILAIAEMTKKYYDQIKVCYYLLTEKVYIV